MANIFRYTKGGGFVCGDTKTGITVYAYPTSTNARRAIRHPLEVAEHMLCMENRHAKSCRSTPEVKNYDAANWVALLSTEYVPNRSAVDPFKVGE